MTTSPADKTNPLMRLWANLGSRALLALALVLLLGCLFSADGAFFKPGTHRD